MTHRPQLDFIRCLAVLTVLFHHFWNHATVAGTAGVRLFFVISGFLITSILLKSRDEVQAGFMSLRHALWNFYVRRALRIFPPYYLIILCGVLAGVDEFIRPIWWHITYTTNIHFARQGYPDLWTAHFWSLSVEEQFYLVWPIAVFLIGSQRLIGVCLLMLFASMAYRAAVIVFGLDAWTWVLPINATDSLGAGALLAFAQGTWWKKHFSNVALLGLITSAVIYGFHLSTGTPQESLEYIFFETMMSVGFVWVVGQAYHGVTGWFQKVAEFPAALFLGRISYGIYLYHELILLVLKKLQIPLWTKPSSWENFVVLSMGSIILASVSWFAYERYWIALKERLSVRGKRYCHLSGENDDLPNVLANRGLGASQLVQRGESADVL